MILSSVTYTSLARPDLQQPELDEIYRSARDANARRGVTGFLIFNGTHFLQTIEGPEKVVEDLADKLRADPRHSGFEVRDKRKVEARSFPDWPMEMVRVRPGLFDARDVIANSLPDTVPEAIRARILRMTELISRMEFPS